MRLVTAGFALALAAPAAAQPVSTQPLAANEVLLETQAEGVVHQQADQTMLMVSVHGTGATMSAARAALAAVQARVTAAARAAGVDTADIGELHGEGALGFLGNELIGGPRRIADEPLNVGKTLQIRLRDRNRFEALRAALEAAGADTVGPLVYSLADEGPSRQAARARALAEARAGADGYARALGLHVGRILRISDLPTAETGQLDMMQAMMRRMTGRNGSADSDIEVDARLVVDFALIP